VSFILEALKKSEQERRRERVPDLRTIHQPVAQVPRQRNWQRWGVLLLVASNLTLVAGGLWWWQQARPAPETGALASAGATGTPAAVTAVTSGTAAPEAAVRGAAPAATAPAHTAHRDLPYEEAPGSPVTAIGPVLPVRPYAELPAAVRNQLPPMTFSFHVYSANPDRRSIIINDRRLREGDPIGNGVELLEITAEGVIVGLAQHRIYMPVLEHW
jgi:general secretion pathway protein B